MRRAFASLVVSLLVVAVPRPAHATDPDTTLYQPVNVDWNRTSLDVVIVPPALGQVFNGDGALGGRGPEELVPISSSYVAATEKAIADWRRAIDAFGSRSLKRLALTVYVVGRDAIPSSVLSEIEIIVTYAVAPYPVLGVTANGPVEVGLNGTTLALGDNPRCKTVNSTFGIMNLTFVDMYNVAGHEFGHCLGVDHVAPGTEQVVKDDMMNAVYSQHVGAKGNRLQCMSNLNVAGLELAYDRLKQPRSAMLLAKHYRRISC